VNETTGKLCIDAGADVLVAGSFVFKDKENIKVLNALGC
jgi:pentose-5-phosphate-3-epimerase